MPSTDIAPLVRFYSSSNSSDSSASDASPSISPIHLRSPPPLPHSFCLMSAATSLFRALFPLARAACDWLRGPHTLALILQPATPLRCLTGTFFGARRGRISFAVQETPRSDPLLLLELATPTCRLVKEMASGMVRILLEAEPGDTSNSDVSKKQGKKKRGGGRPLWEEPVWNMYCNGQRRGYAVARTCNAADARLLTAVRAVSVGAGVLSPPQEFPALPSPDGEVNLSRSGSGGGGGGGGEGEVMYMRARFERVVGNKDSEALYMMNPDTKGKGGPELSVFLLRI
ncbi:hypothetical protein HPP92_013682 [Vanilla planifolia]|uniref:Protein MIZU-KUSSEI 1 n=1 Tax=Vanilla planifolia TaxID=51239 RepID=A0A835QNW6_VANPL|nr:hypothetical protein HPP92_013682 [Vanilla planifolia]